MLPNFHSLQYLQSGNERQKLAFEVLTTLGVFEKLKHYDPVLVGTIPIEIDIPGSDLDVICSSEELDVFRTELEHYFESYPNFSTERKVHQGRESIIARFDAEVYRVELFAQQIPVVDQYAYRHMIKEYQILDHFGEGFRQQIIELKQNGYKTEPAFGQLLDMENAYEELLTYEINNKGKQP